MMSTTVLVVILVVGFLAGLVLRCVDTTILISDLERLIHHN